MKVAVLLSGGVDSSVALRLLKDEGYDVTAFYLKIWLQDEFSFLGDCPWEEDLEFARAVCKQANTPLEIINMQNEYWESVVSYTISEIKDGRTPNPDMFCNRLIKFGQFLNKIDNSFEKVASGHYAKIEKLNEHYLLKTSPDPIKDQTYFLAYLTQDQLSRALFPIGSFTKKEIRALAEKYNLPNMKRKDSQGICFLGKIKFSDFIKHHLGEIEGDIIDVDSNKVMGKHKGYYFYTIGQRSGLRLGGGPWFVVKKDIQNNIIYISRENLTERARKTFQVGKLNWIAKDLLTENDLKVKIRHGEKSYKCKLEISNDKGFVTLEKEDLGIAAGQFAVFYKDDICLGGSVILE
ncbi:MAG TPA: tRNA 2-thiouridine(34) synthase MnmA [Ignavibacteriaceae bacterium]|jgi:tRNA-specific 2-thiouridylase|nr:MAG: tRNA-specific 2-thiouridylase MnmA [Ignavibacteria bacterium ADurb.Bin266]OQY72845.1 MAG: tRNA 2-thiouridine(34) synthase MnmA [Ignavibacteriales bacterium UTCHB2]HQF41949.1 tRNA 2-thiouridine(34) synthase MnmA [Ignavibacteriaceae bacterium]HQI41477.1 tRNA 2-thiouridine(34) synthase MnmA [Ignavibacteriaceae bacterium]